MALEQGNFICFEHVDLCTACENVFHIYFQGIKITQILHHSSQKSMKEAAAEHCYICLIVRADIEPDGTELNTIPLRTGLQTMCSFYENETEGSLIKLEVYTLGLEQALGKHVVTKFRLLPCSGINDVCQSCTLDLGYDTSSPATFDLALEWYKSCYNAHDACNIPLSEQGNWQPTRLIDVGREDEELCTLRTTPLPDGPVRYMTLSYRWGLTTGLKLSKHNFNALYRGIPVSQLPQTFQDAMRIARRFSIQYIWIDALCIIQDCNTDWKREAAFMHYVYSHSECNIAASAAANQNIGLFRPRKKKELLPCIITSPESFSTASKQSFLLFDKKYWDRQLGQGPLHNRGWVFQECLLAPRVLYFAANQIMWKCFHEMKCEGFPQGVPHHTRPGDLTFLWKSIRKQREKQTLARTHREMEFRTHILWNNLLESYSSCDLTYSKDRLPALSGVAQLFANATGDDYLCGLWRSKLIEQLVWRVPRPKPKPLIQLGVPSWSWASTEGQVQVTGLCSDYQSLIAIIEVIKHDIHKGLSSETAGTSLRMTGALSLLAAEGLNDGRYISLGTKRLKGNCYIDNVDVGLTWVNQEVFVLPCLTLHPWFPRRPSKTRLIGLLLMPISDHETNIFRRIGQFSTDSEEDVERMGFTISSQGLATLKKRDDFLELLLV